MKGKNYIPKEKRDGFDSMHSEDENCISKARMCS